MGTGGGQRCYETCLLYFFALAHEAVNPDSEFGLTEFDSDSVVPRGGVGMHTNITVLDDLNVDQSLDAKTYLNDYISNDENISQFFQTYINSSYTDTKSFFDNYKKSTNPLLLSIIIQSLNSKFDSLKAFVCAAQCAEVPVDLIILQETWEIKHPDKLMLPGFQRIVHRTRQGGRGGEWGYMYVMD